MIKDRKSNHSKGIDRVGKIFLVVSTDGVLLRQCLVCEEMFTRQESAEHCRVACFPRT
jgi:hypothetical protein